MCDHAGYCHLADCYDALTGDIPYADMLAFLEKRFAEQGCAPELLLELACGTGSFTRLLAERYNVTALDMSPEMLGLAAEKCRDCRPEVLFLQQDMTAFELYGTVQAAVCTLDAVNCLLTPAALRACFSCVRLYLEPGGLFVFDINSRYKFEHILRDNVFTYETEDSFVVWQNDYHAASRLCDFDVTIFEALADGRYERFDDHIRERAWSRQQIENSLTASGLQTAAVYDGYSDAPASDTSERLVFVVRT